MKYRLSFWLVLLSIFSLSAVRSQTATPPPLATCTAAEAQAALDALPPYQPSATEHFVELNNNQFVVDEEPFAARGVNYYPMRYPWRRFLTSADTNEMQRELNLLRSVGFNTLRLFLWNEALFTCQARGAIPNAEAFQRLDEIIQIAAPRGFRLIITLNDLPNLEHYALYTNPPHTQAQTAFIVERYRNETAILAWDLRNEGDIDYGSINLLNTRFPRNVILNWLSQTSQQVRDLDPNHLRRDGFLMPKQPRLTWISSVFITGRMQPNWQDAFR